jgi:hypothetical protein
MDKLSVQIGTFRLRINEQLSQMQPIMKTVTQKQAENITDKIATIIADCFNEYQTNVNTADKTNHLCGCK